MTTMIHCEWADRALDRAGRETGVVVVIPAGEHWPDGTIRFAADVALASEYDCSAAVPVVDEIGRASCRERV